jgi:hypothetical protein
VTRRARRRAKSDFPKFDKHCQNPKLRSRESSRVVRVLRERTSPRVTSLDRHRRRGVRPRTSRPLARHVVRRDAAGAPPAGAARRREIRGRKRRRWAGRRAGRAGRVPRPRRRFARARSARLARDARHRARLRDVPRRAPPSEARRRRPRRSRPTRVESPLRRPPRDSQLPSRGPRVRRALRGRGHHGGRVHGSRALRAAVPHVRAGDYSEEHARQAPGAVLPRPHRSKRMARGRRRRRLTIRRGATPEGVVPVGRSVVSVRVERYGTRRSCREG